MQQRNKESSKRLGVYVYEWYMVYKYPKHQITTRNVCLTYINIHIRPSRIGKMYLKNVTTKEIQLFLSELFVNGNKSILRKNTRGLSACTVKKIRSLIIAALNQAVREKIINENPAIYTENIRIFNIPKPVFTPEQQAIFLNDAKNYRYYLAYVLLFFTGCRRSEILGLSWSNVSFANSTILIKQVLVVINNKPHLKDIPKNFTSIRTLPIPHEIMQMMIDLKNKQDIFFNSSRYYNKYNLVFCTQKGDMYNPNNLLQNMKKRLKKLGLPTNLHIHSTRHTFATNLIHAKVAIPDIQRLGGWSNPDTLLTMYAHTLLQGQIDAVNNLYDSHKQNIKTFDDKDIAKKLTE